MFWLSHDDKPWFAPKRYGLGAGWPIAWQGWALFAVHVALVVGLGLFMPNRSALVVPAILIVVLLPLPLYAAKTSGGWRWRWGSEQ